jgi:FkbM family methyltransferase
MINKFTKKHPWLTRTIKKHFWSFLEGIKVKSFLYTLDENSQKIKISPNDDSVGKFIFFGDYEKETVSFIAKYLNCGDTVVDVGANIGFFTLIFSKLVRENGEVHSFEPSQREFLLLCENININKCKNVFLNQIALGNNSGFSKMNVLNEGKFGAYNSLRKITHSRVQTEKVQTEKVRTAKFDDYLALFPGAIPSLIKIDVEGFEQQVLEGMQGLLIADNSPCLIIEICEGTHKDEQGSAQELIAYIENFGYHLYSPNSVGNLIPFSFGSSLNCIAIKQSQIKKAKERGVEIVVFPN